MGDCIDAAAPSARSRARRGCRHGYRPGSGAVHDPSGRGLPHNGTELLVERFGGPAGEQPGGVHVHTGGGKLAEAVEEWNDSGLVRPVERHRRRVRQDLAGEASQDGARPHLDENTGARVVHGANLVNEADRALEMIRERLV